MACSIERAQNGKINKIKNEQGEVSKLFKQIFSTLPLSLEESINAYKNTLDGVSEVGKAVTYLNSKGESYNSYQEALKNTDEGKIQLVVGDKTIAEVDSDTSIDNHVGVINHLVKQGVLTGERELDVNGDKVIITAGETQTAKHLTANIVEDFAVGTLGQSSVRRLSNGDFLLENNLSKRVINGEKVDEKEVDDMDYKQLKNKFGEDTAIAIEVEREVEKGLMPSGVKKRIDTDTEVRSESDLVKSVKDLLNKLGIKITSIDDYIKNETIKNGGVEPTATALMDVVNKVMAFKNGEVTEEDLIEETMHLIEASLDPELTKSLRDVIHNSPEWQEHSENYYNIYSKEYSGEKLEEMVRREVLGKVMANAVATNFEMSQNASPIQQTVYSRIKELLQEFFSKLNNFFKSDYQNSIDKLNNDIYVKLMSGELVNDLNVNQNFGDKFRLYSASNNMNSEMYQVQRQAEQALALLEAQSYQIGKKDASQRQRLRQAKESLGKVTEQVKEAEAETDIVAKKKLEAVASAEMTATFAHMMSVARKQLTYLQRASNNNKKGGFHFSSEESAVYNTMISQFDKYVLPSIKNTLEKKSNRTKAEDRILEEVKKVSEEVEKLKSAVDVNEDTYKKHLVDLLVSRLDLNAEKRKIVEDKVFGLQKEANFFFTYFGTLAHSSNIFLNAAGHVVTKTDHEQRQGTLEDTLPFVKKLKDLGFLTGSKLKSLIKDGHLESRFDNRLREDALGEAKYNAYKEVTGADITREDFDKLGKLNDLTTTQRSEYNRKIEDWKLDNFTLSPLSPQEMRDRRDKLASYSQVTQNYERESSLFYAGMMQNAEVVDGIPTFTKEMKEDYEQNRKDRAYAKSIYDLDGKLREGVEYATEEEYTKSLITNSEGVLEEGDITKVSNGLYVFLEQSRASSDSTLAFELNKIDNNRIANMKTKEDVEFSPTFIEALSKLDSEQAYDFLMLNSYVGYTEEYYQGLDRPSIIDRLSEKLGEDNDWEINELINKIATTTKKMNTVLQANRVMNNPSEVSYDNMEKNTEVPFVKEYSALLEEYYSEASKYLDTQEDIEEDNISETVPNRAFIAYMQDKHLSRLDYSDKDILDAEDLANIDKIFYEITEHTTLKKRGQVLQLKTFASDFSKGKVRKFNKMQERVFSLSAEEYEDMSEEEIYSSMIKDVLKNSYTKLLPYFRKSQPTGVDLALNELENGNISPSDFINNYVQGQYKFLKISPNYSFQQANEANNKNPHFQQAKTQGTPMFRTFESETTLEDVTTKSVTQLKAEGKLNKYVDTNFLETYDIDLKTLFETGEEVARANIDKFKAREAILELQKTTLEKTGMTNAHNIYKLPQKEKGKLQKKEEFLKKGRNLRELISEITEFREDESSLGQDLAGNSHRGATAATIPKFGFRDLTHGEVTDELLESYIWMNKEANLYEARQRNLGDMLAIKEAMLASKFENNLAVEASNAYKMLEDQLKYNFFGVKEAYSKEFQFFGRTANVGQILKSFGSVIRFKNLAYNVTIPITSALSGSVQLRIEKVIGERVDSSGFKRAQKRFYKESNGAMRDVMSLSTDSWLNAMGSKFGFYENEERYNNSGYGKVARGLGRSAFLAHTVANFGVNSITALSVLSDHRFVDGQLLQFRSFREANPSKSEKELRSEWDTYKDLLDVSESATDSTNEKNGLIKYNYQKIAEALNNNMTAEEAEKFMEGKDAVIAGKVKLAIQAVDQQIASVDKSILSRNAFTSFLSIHRSWLFLAAQNKFKARQFSTLSGNMEEGSFSSVFRIINSIVKDARAGNVKNIISYIRDRWTNGDSTTRKNLIRGVTEVGFLNALVGLTVLGMRSLDDDDKDEYMFKVANLFLMRTTNEVASSTVALPANMYDVMSNATVGSNIVDMAFDLPDLFSSKEVRGGTFAGMTKREKYFYKNTPGVREYFNLNHIDATIGTYRHFNLSEDDGNLKYFTIFPFLQGSEDK